MAEKTFPLKEISIKELYNSGKATYEVPIYQRNYAWEKDEIHTLIQDVYDAFCKPSKESTIYFIGTLVTFDKGDNVYEVIDGQQRLTTINLILCALGVGISNKLTYKARKKSNRTLQNLSDSSSYSIDEKDKGIINGFRYAEEAILELFPTPKSKEDNSEKNQNDNNEKEKNDFIRFFLENVHIVHYHVPKDIDLNHYFEIMNSRGEQLEKHEIVKARLMSILKSDKDKSTFNRIWESCSDTGVYIQEKLKDLFGNDTNKELFGKNMENLIIKDFSQIPFKNETSTKDESIKELIEKNHSFVKEIEYKSDKFQSIIDFPNFILIVLKLTLIRENIVLKKATASSENDDKESNIILDDKELINQFDKCKEITDENFVKTFGFNLLKAKFLLDNYIVHHSNEDDTDENNPWKLQYWHYENNGNVKNLCSIEGRETNGLQQKLTHLLSMFEVSFTPKQRKNYLLYCLLYLFEEYDGKCFDESKLIDYADFVEGLADKYFHEVYLGEKRNDANTPMPGSFDEAILVFDEDTSKYKKLTKESIRAITKKTKIDFEEAYGRCDEYSKGIPLFVFNYLDYKIWKSYLEALRGKEYKENSNERKEFFKGLGCSDFELDMFNNFYFSRTRRSLEHYYPRANVNDAITEKQINCLGNYAMIGSEANSAGSNWDPQTKVTHYLKDTSGKIKRISVASLKFIIMMKKCEDRSQWLFEEIKEHQSEMLNILFE